LMMKLAKDSSGPAYSSGETPSQAFDKVEPNGTGIKRPLRKCVFL